MSATDDATPLLAVESLSVAFAVAARTWAWRPQMLQAVDGVNLAITRGESFALVGESGSGKTTIGRAMLGLYRPSRGSVRYDGVDVCTLRGAELKRFRSRAQMIFQDPYASLNPRMKVGAIIAEPLRAHGYGSAKRREGRVAEMLALVGLPGDAANRFPYAFSGGQRQRIGIARALALGPEFVVADEPVSALDVSIQAQVLNLLADLREELSLTTVFIAHNLAVVRHIASRVAVMYLGQIVEVATRDEIFSTPAHPYTRALLRAVPPPDPTAGWKGADVALQGDIPSALTPPAGCRFHTRCPEVTDICRRVVPPMQTWPSGRQVACHLATPPDSPAMSVSDPAGPTAGGPLAPGGEPRDS